MFDDSFVEKTCFHARALDRFIELRPLHASMGAAYEELRACLSSHFTSDLVKLVKALEVMCPPWQPHKETLLTHSASAHMLLNMPEKHIENIGPIVAELVGQKELMESTGFLDPSTVVAAKSGEKLGRETLVYGLVTRCMLRDWHKLKSPAEAKEAVAALRAAISPKGVLLTDQMNAQLAEWESGAKISALHAARLLQAARSPLRRRRSSSPVPLEALEAASRVSSGSAAPLPAAPLPARPTLDLSTPKSWLETTQEAGTTQAATPAPTQAAQPAPTPPERQSLSQRAAAAKRRKQ